MGYVSYATTTLFRERGMRVMKKPVTMVLDWLWHCHTYLMMKHGGS